MDGIYRVFCFPYTLVYIREIFQNRQKTGYVELNIEQSYCKLTLKASESVLPGNNRFLKLSVFIFFFFFVGCNSRAQKAIGVLLGKFPSCIYSFIELLAIKAIYYSTSKGFRGSRRQCFVKSAIF